MKKITFLTLLLVNILFLSCFSLPGYVNSDGSITPPYSKEILIESLEGVLSIIPSETSKGLSNIRSVKSDPLRTKKGDTIYLSGTDIYRYNLEGNHSVVLAFRTISNDAKFKITYKNETTEYTIHSSDVLDKYIYIENY